MGASEIGLGCCAVSVIWQRVKEFISDRDVRQKVVAERIGITEEYFSMLVNGRGANQATIWLEAIAAFFGVDVAELIRDRRAPSWPTKRPDLHLDLETIIKHGSKDEIEWVRGYLIVFADRVRTERDSSKKSLPPSPSSGATEIAG